MPDSGFEQMPAEMPNLTESNYRLSSIIGMDLFTPHIPDLRAFKHAILTGKVCTNQIQEVVDFDPQASNHDVSLNFLLQLSMVIQRALEDAGLEQTSFSSVRIGIVLHFSPFFEKNQISGDSHWVDRVEQRLFDLGLAPPAKIVTIQAGQPFNVAVEQAQALLQAGKCEYVALCGVFAYSRPGSSLIEETSIPNVNDTHPGSVWGTACMLLSNPGVTGKTYADLISESAENSRQVMNDRSRSFVDNEEYTPGFYQDQTVETRMKMSLPETHAMDVPASIVEERIQRFRDLSFFQIPIIRMMRSALSLNSKTVFSDFDEIRLEDGDLSENTRTPIRPWFLPPYQEKRESEVLLSQTAMIWVKKDAGADYHPDRPFSNLGLFLLPIDLEKGAGIGTVLADLEREIKTCGDLSSFAHVSLLGWSQNRTGKQTLVLLGRNIQDFVSEIAHARMGVEKAHQEGRDWQTPAGSFYTPNPLGERGKIAFVYPGAFGTYVGMGREIFYLFPELHDSLQALTDDPGRTINEAVIFLTENSPEKSIQQQGELDRSPTRMISSGICFSYLFTTILRDIFKVQPQAAFGYSLGEISMMFAMGIWSQADAMRTSLEVSPVFQERVSGPQNAIREFWGIPAGIGEQESRQLWSNLVVLAPVEKVREAVEREDRVYITHINAPRQVVIGGDHDACQRVVSDLKCMHLETPYRHAIHCPPVMSEFNHFLSLHDWPVEQQPDIPVYSAANYAALEYDPKSVAESFARMLTQPIDFPRLAELAYQDGARIFIELGAGSNCSKWVESTLKGRPHASYSINANQVSDHVSILMLLARLISHQVPLEPDALVR